MLFGAKGLTEPAVSIPTEESCLASVLQYEVPTWSQIYDMLLSLAQRIRHAGFVSDVVVAVARGGLVPGRVLVDLLEVPELAILQIQYYTGIAQTQAAPTIKQALSGSVSGKKVLLVDDIADTGMSLKLAHAILQRQGAAHVRIATLYHKPQSVIQPDFCVKETENWVIFPWDTKEMLRKIIQKQVGKRQAKEEIAKIVKAGLPKQLADKLLADMQ